MFVWAPLHGTFRGAFEKPNHVSSGFHDLKSPLHRARKSLKSNHLFAVSFFPLYKSICCTGKSRNTVQQICHTHRINHARFSYRHSFTASKFRLHNSVRSFMRRVRADITQKRACRILRFCPTEQGSKNNHKSRYFHAATRAGESSKNGMHVSCIILCRPAWFTR